VSFAAKHSPRSNDFVVSYARQTDTDAESRVRAFVGRVKEAGYDSAARGAEGAGYFALRLSADLPAE